MPAVVERSDAVIGLPEDWSTAEIMFWEGRRSSNES